MSKRDYYAVIRKDGYRWAADLYKDGKLFYKSWQYNWRTKGDMIVQIEAQNVDWRDPRYPQDYA
jgi:hypothetical protein